MYLNVNKAYSNFDSQLAKEEKNDCVVRSLAVASGSAYETAHTFCNKKFGRENKKGTDNLAIVTQMLKFEENGLQIGDKNLKVKVLGKSDTKNKYKLYGEIIWREKTLKSFVESHPKGTFLVMVAKHALVVKDGEVFDWNSNKFLPTRKVQAVYEIIEEKNETQLSLF